MTKTAIGRLRLVGIIEGISYLVLLFIAMPLKYIWDRPLAVKYTGSAHGALFVLLMLTLVLAMPRFAKPFKTAVIVFIAALIPLRYSSRSTVA